MLKTKAATLSISDEIANIIEKAADKELTKLVAGWQPDKIAECIAAATFKARREQGSGKDKDPAGSLQNIL